MTREFLERIYFACSGEAETVSDGTKMADLYEHFEDVSKADHYFSEKLYAIASLNNQEKQSLDTISGSACMVYEKQGFINGFRLGMKLAGELRREEAAT